MDSVYKRHLCVAVTMALVVTFCIGLIVLGVHYTWKEKSFIQESECVVVWCYQQYLRFTLINWEHNGLNYTQTADRSFSIACPLGSFGFPQDAHACACPPNGSNITCYFDSRDIYYTLSLDPVPYNTGNPLIYIASIVGGLSLLLALYSLYIIYDIMTVPERADETSPLL